MIWVWCVKGGSNMLYKTQKISNWLFLFGYLITLVLLVILRIDVLKLFAFQYVDSDQSIMWNAAVDFSKGIFHEPLFYGQAYNSMAEAFFAVPLLWSKIEACKALPLITSIFTLLPFVLVSVICIYKNLKPQAILILAFPLFLPLEYDFITSLPRGFIPGIFFASLGCVAIYFSKNKFVYFIAGLFMVLGYSLNPNSLLLTLTCLLFLFLDNYNNQTFYLYFGSGLFPGLIINYLMNHYYVSHPEHNFYGAPAIDFSFDKFISAYSNLDKHLNFITPLFWKSGWLILPIIFLISFLIYISKNKKQGVALAFSLILIMMSFGANKIYDGTNSVFFSYSRMFLAIPLLIAYFVPFIQIKRNSFSILFFLVSICFFIFKQSNLEASIKKNLGPDKENVIMVTDIRNVKSECQRIGELSKKYHIDLIVVVNYGFYDFLDFGCTTCIDSFPKTIRPCCESRVWRLQEDKDKVYSNVFIMDEYQQMKDQLPNLSSKSINFLNLNGNYIITNNTLTTLELLKLLNIPLRSF